MIARHLSRTLRAAARDYRVVTVTGPRQSGKTTLVRATFPKHRYASLEDPDARAFAVADPRGFLGQFRGRVILDEVQRVPELFSYMQGIVDRADRPGQFILSGSQDFLLLNRVSQTLASRRAVLRLLPFSRSELIGRAIRGLTNPLPTRRADGARAPATAGDMFETLFTGGFPRIHDKGLKPQPWLANYYQTYLERDVRDLPNVGDLERFGRFVRLCAGRSGQLLNASSLGADAGVGTPGTGAALGVGGAPAGAGGVGGADRGTRISNLKFQSRRRVRGARSSLDGRNCGRAGAITTGQPAADWCVC
jgi:uncharacterized protein